MPKLRVPLPKHQRLRVLIQGTIAALGKSTDDVARIWDCSNPTVLKRLREPGSITIDQLLTLGRGLGIPLEEIRNAISER